MRKTFSVAFFVISGFFFYTVCLSAFVSGIPPTGKYAAMGLFCIPAIAFLGIGTAIGRSGKWKRDSGMVLLSAAGLSAFLVLTMACLLLSPEAMAFFAGHNLDFFSDYGAGVGCMALLGASGAVLIKMG